jgi:hypothetical protein
LIYWPKNVIIPVSGNDYLQISHVQTQSNGRIRDKEIIVLAGTARTGGGQAYSFRAGGIMAGRRKPLAWSIHKKHKGYMPSGRPTKYNEEMLQKALEYSQGYWRDRGDSIPSYTGLCRYLEVDKETIHDWAKKEPIFSAALRTIKQDQEIECLNKGLNGEFNSAITKLVLHNHGYKDRHDHTTNDRDLPQPLLDVRGNNGNKSD